MSRANCIKLYEHIVETNGKPDTQYCLANFGAEGYDFCSRFYTEIVSCSNTKGNLEDG